MLACGPALSAPFLALIIGMMVLFIGVPLVNLGALTAVAFRPGAHLRSITFVGRVAVVVGLVMTVAGIEAPFLGLLGLLQVALGLTTLRLNGRQAHPMV